MKIIGFIRICLFKREMCGEVLGLKFDLDKICNENIKFWRWTEGFSLGFYYYKCNLYSVLLYYYKPDAVILFI